MSNSSASEWGDDWQQIGRALGQDLYRHTPCDPDAAWPAEVQDGWRHARDRGWRRREAGYHVRQWVHLRLNAHLRGCSVDADVTPQWLRRIDVGECPVLRVPLTHAQGLPSDAAIDRLDPEGAYAPGNLAVTSTAAYLARGRRTFEDVLLLSQCDEPTGGLQSVHWLRLAALMLGPCFATYPESAPDLPMPVPLPNGTMRTAFQQVQSLFAITAGRTSGRNKIVRYFQGACPDESSLVGLRELAGIVHESLKDVAVCWDVWLEPGTLAALVRWRDAMGPQAWRRVDDLCVAAIGGRASNPPEPAAARLERHGSR